MARLPAPERPAPNRSCGGFTLVEALVVVSIVAILAAASVPQFDRLMASARVQEAGGSLRGALELARSEAMNRAVPVGACRSPDANTASPACSDAASGAFGAGDWAAGWLVYAKAGANVANTFEAGDVILRRQAPLGRAEASRAMLWAPAAGAIVYGWNGVRIAGPVGSFSVDHGPATATRSSPLHSNRAACLAVNVAGRIDAQPLVAGGCA